MKKRTKILSFLAAAVLAVSVMALGFAAWSTDITIEGGASADGKWDVKVTDAYISLSSSGAAYGTTSEDVEGAELTAYPLYAVTNSAGKTVVSIDLINSYSLILTEDEAYDYTVQVLYNPSWVGTSVNGAYFYGITDSETLSQYLTENTYFYLYLNEGIYTNGNYSRVLKDYTGEEGAYIGYAIVSVDVKTADYGTITVTSEDTTTFTDTSVSFADVVFSLPSAWAAYTVEISNEGTVNANLTELEFDTSGLPSDLFTVSYESLDDIKEDGNDVLEPGQTAKLVYVVKVVDEDSAPSDFTTYEVTGLDVTIKYEADTVEDEAPDAGYTIITSTSEEE